MLKIMLEKFLRVEQDSKPLEELNLQKEYKNQFSDVIGTHLYDKNIHKIELLKKRQNLEKKQEFRFFSWLDQYI